MKKLFYLLLLIPFLNSCITAEIGSLKRDYSKNVRSYQSDLPFEKVWSRAIDFFSERGIAIQTVDKSSGLIVSGNYSFTNSVTIESSDGGFFDNEKWIVCACPFLPDGTVVAPNVANGDFNLRIKQEDGKTIINVNLLPREFYQSANTSFGPVKVDRQAFSTGVFEKKIAEFIDPNIKKL